MVDKRDIAILRVIDGLRSTYLWVPVNEIIKRLPWGRVEIKRRIRELEKNKLIVWRSRGWSGIPEVRITERALDTLAIWDFAKHGVFDRLGAVIGEGKEAKVVLAIKDEEPIVIKFHRFYTAEFEKIEKSLAYASLMWRKEELRLVDKPIDVPRAKAQIEFFALNKLYKKIPVPKPIAINRHAIAMGFIGQDFIPAPLLKDVEPEAEWEEEILENYERALKEGIVHGDLSEFNIMVHDELYFIDWPQAVPRSYMLAEELERRDKERIREFFRKKLSKKKKLSEKL